MAVSRLMGGRARRGAVLLLGGGRLSMCCPAPVRAEVGYKTPSRPEPRGHQPRREAAGAPGRVASQGRRSEQGGRPRRRAAHPPGRGRAPCRPVRGEDVCGRRTRTGGGREGGSGGGARATPERGEAGPVRSAAGVWFSPLGSAPSGGRGERQRRRHATRGAGPRRERGGAGRREGGAGPPGGGSSRGGQKKEGPQPRAARRAGGAEAGAARGPAAVVGRGTAASWQLWGAKGAARAELVCGLSLSVAPLVALCQEEL